jgi:hypothetical protein
MGQMKLQCEGVRRQESHCVLQCEGKRASTGPFEEKVMWKSVLQGDIGEHFSLEPPDWGFGAETRC